MASLVIFSMQWFWILSILLYQNCLCSWTTFYRVYRTIWCHLSTEVKTEMLYIKEDNGVLKTHRLSRMARWTRMTFLSLKREKMRIGWEIIPVNSVGHQQGPKKRSWMTIITRGKNRKTVIFIKSCSWIVRSFFFFFFNIVGVSPQSPLNGLSQLIVTQHQTEIMTLLKETPTEPTV